MADLPGAQTVGREPIHTLWEKLLSSALWFEQEALLPTLFSGDIARTSTPPGDGADAGAQVVHWQPGGTWRRLLDQPELVPSAH
jgi:hypothetical protein